VIISSNIELEGITKISEVVGITLKKMREYAKPGISTKDLDNYGMQILNDFGARSAPMLAYNFPGYTCISINNEIAHGVPSDKKILKEGDLINIDVSAELNGYWSDNGGSFVLGQDFHNYSPLINASKVILHNAISKIKSGVRISEIGKLINNEAKKSGFKVIKNLTGHGVGRSLHEEPEEIANFKDHLDLRKFQKNSVVAIETFIATHSSYANPEKDGWTLTGDKGGCAAQHEHTIIVTDDKPKILTLCNAIWE